MPREWKHTVNALCQVLSNFQSILFLLTLSLSIWTSHRLMVFYRIKTRLHTNNSLHHEDLEMLEDKPQRGIFDFVYLEYSRTSSPGPSTYLKYEPVKGQILFENSSRYISVNTWDIGQNAMSQPMTFFKFIIFNEIFKFWLKFHFSILQRIQLMMI